MTRGFYITGWGNDVPWRAPSKGGGGRGYRGGGRGSGGSHSCRGSVGSHLTYGLHPAPWWALHTATCMHQAPCLRLHPMHVPKLMQAQAFTPLSTCTNIYMHTNSTHDNSNIYTCMIMRFVFIIPYRYKKRNWMLMQMYVFVCFVYHVFIICYYFFWTFMTLWPKTHTVTKNRHAKDISGM